MTKLPKKEKFKRNGTDVDTVYETIGPNIPQHELERFTNSQIPEDTTGKAENVLREISTIELKSNDCNNCRTTENNCSIDGHSDNILTQTQDSEFHSHVTSQSCGDVNSHQQNASHTHFTHNMAYTSITMCQSTATQEYDYVMPIHNNEIEENT